MKFKEKGDSKVESKAFRMRRCSSREKVVACREDSTKDGRKDKFVDVKHILKNKKEKKHTMFEGMLSLRSNEEVVDIVMGKSERTRSIHSVNFFKKSLFYFLWCFLLFGGSHCVKAANEINVKIDEDGLVQETSDIVDLHVSGSSRNMEEKCQDEKGKHDFTSVNQVKGCGWVREKKEKRCIIAEAKVKCPKTCGKCDDLGTVPSEKKGSDSNSSPPSLAPISRTPVSDPTSQPSEAKTNMPTSSPTALPTSSPTSSPTASPSASPTATPTNQPFPLPSAFPTSTVKDNGAIDQNMLGGKHSPASAPKTGTISTSPGKTKSTSTPSKGKGSNLSPSQCEDEPNWIVSGIIEDSGLKPFEGMSCAELENEIEDDKYENWCNFHRVGTKDGKSAFEACCFCGGGKHVETPCQDFQDWSMDPSSADNIVNCKFIEEDVKDSESFCNRIKMHKGLAGQTALDACCICGGGFRPTYAVKETSDQCSSESEARKLSSENYDNYNRFDYHYHTDLGDSPGIPNLEFLGLGYDGLRGNPRGSFSSEIDPGFRSRVFALLQSQDKTSIDAEYTIPLGTDFKYTSSCHYDDRSVEVSSEQDYSRMLSSEADLSSGSSSSSSKTETYNQSFDFGFSAIFPIKGLFLGIGGSLSYGRSGSEASSESQSQAFQKSEKFSSFSSLSRAESSISFESKAICSEFEIQFNEYDSQTLDPRFEEAMNCLPDKYEPENLANKAKFVKFIANYGTHYTRKVVLGAKRILTTTMSSNAVAELNRQSVDIASTLSVQMQEAMAKTSSERFGASIAATLAAVPKGANVPQLKFSDGSEGLSVGGGDDSPSPVTVNCGSCKGDDKNDEEKKEDPKAEGSLQASFTNEDSSSSTSSRAENFSSFSRNKQQSESASRISEKRSRTTEVNIGGLPKSNWRDWAESVKEKPMPIQYELVGLWNLMSDKKAEAFFEAFKDIEEVDIKPQESDSLLDAMHFGVSNGLGEPLSSYSLDPNVDFRALLRTENIDPKSVEFNTLNVLGNTPEIKNKDHGDFLACGLEFDLSNDGRSEDSPIGIALTLVLCNINTSSNTRLLGKSFPGNKKMCPMGSFINGISIQTKTLQKSLESETKTLDRTGSEWSFEAEKKNLLTQEMVYGLKFDCKTLDGRGSQELVVFELEGEDEKWQDWKRLPESDNEQNTRFGIVSFSYKSASHHIDFKHNATPDHNNQNRRFYKDIYQFAVTYKAFPIKGSALENGTRTYSAFWKGKQDAPHAIFATAIHGNSIGRDASEESKLGFLDTTTLSTDILNGMPYGISDSYFSSGALAMTNFNKSAKSLRSFNFLTVDDFPINREKLMTGIVSDRILLLNDEIDVEISKVGEATYSIHFLGLQHERPIDPIIIASPHWYTKSKSMYPSGLGEVSIALVENNEWNNGFHVALGSSSVNQMSQYVGFNFLAIDSNLDHKNIKVGHVSRQKLSVETKSKVSACEGHGYSETQCNSIGIDDSCCFWNGDSCVARDNGQCQIGSKSFDVEWTPVSNPGTITSIEFCEVLFNNCRSGNKISLNADFDFEMARVKFTEAFDAIPTVILTPVLSDFDECRSFEEGFGSGNGDLGEELSIPHCIVDTIEKHSFAAKCGCLRSISGTSTFEYKNIPFNFIATGPADEKKAVQAKKWRLVSESSLEDWDMSKLQMFSHSKVLEPMHVFASDHINGTFPCNVVNDESFWTGAESREGILYIGFEFKNKEKVTKVMFQNFSNSHHPKDVRLEALIGSNWQEVVVTKDINPTDNAWNSMVVLPRRPDIYTSPTQSPTNSPSASPSVKQTLPPSNPSDPKVEMKVKIGDFENSGENTTVFFQITSNMNKETPWEPLAGGTFTKDETIVQDISNIMKDISNADYIKLKVNGDDKNTTVFVEDIVLQDNNQQLVADFNSVIKQGNDEDDENSNLDTIFRKKLNSKLVYYSGTVGTCDDLTDADILLTVYGRLKLDDGSIEYKSFEHKFHGDSACCGNGQDLSLNHWDEEPLYPRYKENIGEIYKVKLKNKGEASTSNNWWKVSYIEMNKKIFNFDCTLLETGDEVIREIW